MDIAALGLQIDVAQLDKLSASTDKATNHVYLMNLKLTEIIRQLEVVSSAFGRAGGNIDRVSGSASRANTTLGHMASTIYRIGQSWQYAGGPMSNAIAVMTNLVSTTLHILPALNRSVAGVLALGGAVGGLSLGLGAALGLFTVTGLAVGGFVKAVMEGRIETIAFSDATLRLARELAVVTSSTTVASQVWTRLYQVSYDTRTSMDTTIDSFTRLTRSTENLGISQNQVIAITSLMNKALAIGGPTAQEMRSGLTQLSQALAKGKVDGDEFRSLMENFPYIMRRVAAGIHETGVNLGVLKELSTSGKLTAEEFLNSLIRGSARIDADYKKMSITVEEASIRVRNAMTNLFKPAIDEEGRFISEFPAIIDMLTEVTRLIESGIGTSVKDVVVDVINWFGRMGKEYIKTLTDMERYGATVFGKNITFGAISSKDYKPSQSRAFIEQEKLVAQTRLDEEQAKIAQQRERFNKQFPDGTSWSLANGKQTFEEKYADSIAYAKTLTENVAKADEAIAKLDFGLRALSISTFVQNIDSAKKSISELTSEIRISINDLKMVGTGIGLEGISALEGRLKAIQQIRKVQGMSGMNPMSIDEEEKLGRLRNRQADLEDKFGENSVQAELAKSATVAYGKSLSDRKLGFTETMVKSLAADNLELANAEKAGKQVSSLLADAQRNVAQLEELKTRVELDPKKTKLGDYVAANVTAAGKAFDAALKASSVPSEAFSPEQLTNIASARKAATDLAGLQATATHQTANKPEENKLLRDRAAIEAYMAQAVNERLEAQLRLQNVEKMNTIDAEMANKTLSERMGLERTLETQLRKRQGFTDEEIDKARSLALEIAKANEEARQQLQVKQRLEGMQESQQLDTAALARRQELVATGAYLSESDAYIRAKETELGIAERLAKTLAEIERLRPDDAQRKELVAAAQRQAGLEREVATNEEMIKSQQVVRQVNESIASTMASSFADVALGANSAREAIEDLAKSTLRFLIELTARQGILTMLTGMTSNKQGGLNSAGSLIAGVMQLGLNLFKPTSYTGTAPAVGPTGPGGMAGHAATGMVFDGPTRLRTRSGTTEVGEAGPEGLFPLVRDNRGRLSIRASGGSSRTINAPISVTQNVNYSSGQSDQSPVHARKMADDVRRELQSVVREVLLDEQRPGGAFA